jgi:glycosyltransferase involved in cell wall biosynthesis
MNSTRGAADAQDPLARRLGAIAHALLDSQAAANPHNGTLLDHLVEAVQQDWSLDRVWLLCTAVFGGYPTGDDVRAAARYMQLSSPAQAGRWLLQQAIRSEVALNEKRHRAAEQEFRSRVVAARAAVGLRHPRIAEAGRVLVSAGKRNPRLWRGARFGWHQLMMLGTGLARARVQVGRRVALRPGRSRPGVSRHAGLAGSSFPDLQLVTEQVVVDVDHSARHDLHTGIQHVVRRTIPIWDRDHPLVLAAWTRTGGGLRTLSEPETARVLTWGADGADGSAAAPPEALIVPWRTVVVLMETPPSEAVDQLAALAQYSGNSVVAVGYDCIPAVSADLVPTFESERFARYLSVLKFSRRIAGISDSATAEFAGFGAALAAQGLPSPSIFACRLAAERPSLPAEPRPAHEPPTEQAPVVLCVGVEPRKNTLVLLYAAERLWREKLDFRLRFIAGSGWGDEAIRRIAELRALGRPVSVSSAVTDTELRRAYQAARFTMFVSLHEGYGLPVAESLALGTPVITSNYGSTSEVAAGGGALLVDPRDDEAIVDAMRQLLTDDNLRHTLCNQIAARPVRTWEEYARDLWTQLVKPELRPSAGEASTHTLL